MKNISYLFAGGIISRFITSSTPRLIRASPGDAFHILYGADLYNLGISNDASDDFSSGVSD